MRAVFVPIFFLLVASASADPAWMLVWRDEFDGKEIDAKKWSRCERGKSDLNDTMSNDPRCFSVGSGTLRLSGITERDGESVRYLTGGLTSKGKFSFHHGKVEIRARFKSARGAWPALWMLGEKGGWPSNGEIDLMEHLNFDDIVYQTVHSPYTQNLPEGAPSQEKFVKAAIPAREDFNTYGAEWDKNTITFIVNGRPTHTYRRLPGLGADQWPFDQPFYLILSMQIGGKWVGKADPADYPAWLEIDWVRVWKKK